jgi:hypothetical protein
LHHAPRLFARKADVKMAVRRTRGLVHGDAKEGIDLARACGARELVLFLGGRQQLEDAGRLDVEPQRDELVLPASLELVHVVVRAEDPAVRATDFLGCRRGTGDLEPFRRSRWMVGDAKRRFAPRVARLDHHGKDAGDVLFVAAFLEREIESEALELASHGYEEAGHLVTRELRHLLAQPFDGPLARLARIAGVHRPREEPRADRRDRNARPALRLVGADGDLHDQLRLMDPPANRLGPRAPA